MPSRKICGNRFGRSQTLSFWCVFAIDGGTSGSFVDWLLVLLACLIPLDVGLRRVQLDAAVIKSWFGLGRHAPPSDATFDALLMRKRHVTETLRQRPSDTDMARLVAERGDGKEPEAEMAADETAPPEPEPVEKPLSTTERLLAARQRAQRDSADTDKGPK